MEFNPSTEPYFSTKTPKRLQEKRQAKSICLNQLKKPSTAISFESKRPSNRKVDFLIPCPDNSEIKSKKSSIMERTYVLPTIIDTDPKRNETLKIFAIDGDLKNEQRDKKLKIMDFRVDRGTNIEEIEIQKQNRLKVLDSFKKKSKGTMYISELWAGKLYSQVLKTSGLGNIIDNIRKSRYQSKDTVGTKLEKAYKNKHPIEKDDDMFNIYPDLIFPEPQTARPLENPISCLKIEPVKSIAVASEDTITTACDSHRLDTRGSFFEETGISRRKQRFQTMKSTMRSEGSFRPSTSATTATLGNVAPQNIMEAYFMGDFGKSNGFSKVKEKGNKSVNQSYDLTTENQFVKSNKAPKRISTDLLSENSEDNRQTPSKVVSAYDFKSVKVRRVATSFGQTREKRNPQLNQSFEEKLDSILKSCNDEVKEKGTITEDMNKLHSLVLSSSRRRPKDPLPQEEKKELLIKQFRKAFGNLSYKSGHDQMLPASDRVITKN